MVGQINGQEAEVVKYYVEAEGAEDLEIASYHRNITARITVLRLGMGGKKV